MFDTIAIGQWLVAKARRQAAAQGVQPAARNLRKQGLPLELALAILAPRGPRVSGWHQIAAGDIE